MSTGFVELTPKYFLNENWEISEPIPPKPALLLMKKALPEEEEWRKWIKSTRIEVAGTAETTKISSDEKYDYFKSELGMNIILPKGSIEGGRSSMDEMRQGMGPGGFCICSKCGYKKPHEAGIPCRDEKCPKCGTKMVREGSYHHKLIEEKKKKGGD